MIEQRIVNVLDHGFVRIIDHMGNDLSVVRAARVSYNAAWRAGADHASDERLINYLWTNKHTTPFEAVTFTFEVCAPIFVIRQWHRHRTWSYNEASARYKEMRDVFYVPAAEVIGEQAKKNKQARTIGKVTFKHKIGRRLVFWFCDLSYLLYRLLLWFGWPRELARIVLPLNVYTHMFASVDLLNLLKFLSLRLHPHAQWETRQYAEALRVLAHRVAPVCLDVWALDSSEDR